MSNVAVLTGFRCHRRTRYGVSLGLVALLLQTLIPFSQALPAPWQTQSGVMLVCQSFGVVQTVPLALASDSTKQNQSGSHPFQCPVCQLQVTCGAGLPPPTATAALRLPVLRSSLLWPNRDNSTSYFRYTPTQPRAPPLLAVQII